MGAGRNTIVAVVSAKGGVGKSLLATNLGAAAAAQLHIQALVLDLNAGTGVDDLLLDLKPEKTWGHLLPVFREVTLEHLELAWTTHATGLRMLSAPEEFLDPSSLDEPRVTAILRIVNQACHLVIVDCPTGLTATTRDVLKRADLVLCLLTSDTPCLRSTQRMLSAMTDLRTTELIISQYEPGSVLTPAEVTEVLKRPVVGLLPIDARAVWENVHLGQPCALSRKRGLGAEYRRLAKVVADRMIMSGSLARG